MKRDAGRVRLLELLAGGAAVVCLLAFLFLPLFLIHLQATAEADRSALHTGEVTVGIAVILRATTRRLVRTGTSNVLRTTFGTFTRATARAATRRLVRIVVHSMIGLLSKKAIQLTRNEEELRDPPGPPKHRPVLAVILGFVALSLSFLGILAILDPVTVTQVTDNRTMSFVTAALLAGIPLPLYALFTWIGARIWEISVTYRTAPDGLLIQAYFTGAGSFLPMTTDIEYEGDDRSMMRVALFALGMTYLTHLALALAAYVTGSYLLTFCSSMFLIYCFVYSFPIRPLEGHYVWARSKFVWFCMWIPILLSFLQGLPETIAQIL